ncbi:MAG: GDP-mannose 4,6-dehydratase [Chloroflexota bacterium]
MRVLITGINGFVGGYLAERFLATGEWDIYGVGRAPNVSLTDLRDRITYQTMDFSSRDGVQTVLEQIKPDIIFHLAAQADVHRSFAEPEETLTANIFPALHIFQSVVTLGQQPLILIVGSNEVYGRVQPEDLPVDEETPFRPVSPYAVSKATQDMLAHQYMVSNNLRTIRLRPFNHTGPRQSEQFVACAFAAQIARIEAGQQEPLLRVGNLVAERDFTDVRDMVRAYELVATRGTIGQVYNIGSGRSTSIQWLLETLLSLSTCDIAVEPDPARMRPADIPRIVCDSRRLAQHTDWTPQIPLEQTLSDILNYWRAHV